MTKSEQETGVELLDPILSIPVNVARLKSLGETVKATADEEGCEALRDRLGILAVHSFAIDAKVTPWKKKGVRIEGHVLGEIEQACVVTLQPVAESINQPFNLTLLPAGSAFTRRSDDNPTGGEMIIDPEGEDPPEIFEGDEIEVGRYAEEFFALSLDDYPRAVDAEFEGHIEDAGGPDSPDNPFAALAGLRGDLKKDTQN